MKVIINKTNTLLDDFYKVDEIILQHEKFDGTISELLRRLNLDRGDSVGVLLKSIDTNEFIFVNQFRYADYKKSQNGWLDEIIAGSFNDGNPAKCAINEVFEETGYAINELIPMGNFYVSPGGTCEKVFLYFAEVNEKLKKGKGGGLESENEDIIEKRYSEGELISLLNADYFQDAKTIIAIQRYLLNKELFETEIKAS